MQTGLFRLSVQLVLMPLYVSTVNCSYPQGATSIADVNSLLEFFQV